MTLEQIKQAIAQNKNVYCKNKYYKVIKDSKNQYLIACDNGYCIGLTWRDGVTMNGEPKDFYTE